MMLKKMNFVDITASSGCLII